MFIIYIYIKYMFNSINYDIFDKSESGMGGESEQGEDGDYFVGFENEEFE